MSLMLASSRSSINSPLRVTPAMHHLTLETSSVSVGDLKVNVGDTSLLFTIPTAHVENQHEQKTETCP